MRARATKAEGGYRLAGVKTGLSNAPIADVFVVWAKSDAHGGAIRGFILDKGAKGLSTPKIEGKLSLRASVTGMIHMDDVDVGEDALLPDVEGLKRIRSAASTAFLPVTASPGALSGPRKPASTPPGSTGLIASSSAGRWPPPSSIRRSWPI